VQREIYILVSVWWFLVASIRKKCKRGIKFWLRKQQTTNFTFGQHYKICALLGEDAIVQKLKKIAFFSQLTLDLSKRNVKSLYFTLKPSHATVPLVVAMSGYLSVVRNKSFNYPEKYDTIYTILCLCKKILWKWC